MEEFSVHKALNELKDGKKMELDALLCLLDYVEKVLFREPNLIAMDGDVAVAGDLHGQFYDFLNMLEKVEHIDQLLFLGDYVDRGCNSVELITYLFLLKLDKPHKIFLLRGNHENRAQTEAYGLMRECVAKYNYYVYWRICDVFELLPLAAIVNKVYFCVHGGITPGLTLDLLQNSDRIAEYSLSLGPVMWSDPCSNIEGFEESQRGAGYLFGDSALQSFLEKIACKYLVRSHQLVFDGVMENFGGKCITVWSAPNYCYKCRNMAAIMIISRDSHKFIFFDAVPIQYKPHELK